MPITDFQPAAGALIGIDSFWYELPHGCIDIVREVITSFYDDKIPVHKKMKKQPLH